MHLRGVAVIGAVQLQFGHGTSAVETTPPLRCTCRPSRSTLQFGHGTSAVETLGGSCFRHNRVRSGFNSATAHRPWKRPCAQLPKSARQQASIRPRHIGRGNMNCYLDYEPLGTASIRPRHIGRGNPNRSRKTRSYSLVLQFGHGTSAVETAIGRDKIAPQYPASIRPRHIGRGNSNLPFWATRTSAASIRPRHIGRGNAGGHGFPVEQPAASIRPRHIGRGNVAAHRKFDFICEASIRPRHIGRGNRSKLVRSSFHRRLQFGHGTSAVETSPTKMYRYDWPTLQFGHGTSAVETRHWRAPPTCLSGFNSATAHRPWKLCSNHFDQFGGPGFNSATAHRPWKPLPPRS